MQFPAATRAQITMRNIETNFDPTGATVRLEIGDTPYTATWLGAATVVRAATPERDGLWRRSARTDSYFSGTAQASTVTLPMPPPRLYGRFVVSKAGDEVAGASEGIDVT